jgi:uncharacterized protein
MTASIRTLKSFFSGIKKCAVAFSGGVDSSLVLKAAAGALGPKNVIAVTGVSETYPPEDLKSASEIAKKTGVRHIIVRTRELANGDFSANPPDRCYHCKTELFTKIRRIADSMGFDAIVDGSNLDDFSDFRPGIKAAKCAGVLSPLAAIGATKKDVRRMSRLLGMPTWNRPQSPCLASRVPYGTRITPEILKKVSGAEKVLGQYGFKNLRVRHYGDLARIEVDPRDIRLLLRKLNRKMIKRIKSLGYKYVTVDAEGFRSGSMNEALTDK